MKGRRRPDSPIGKIPRGVRAGDFWKVLTDDGDRPIAIEGEPSNLTGCMWRVAAPMSYGFAIGTLTKHTVREEDDGTISVRAGDGSSNSILITGHAGEQWHGYIERGTWSHV